MEGFHSNGGGKKVQCLVSLYSLAFEFPSPGNTHNVHSAPRGRMTSLPFQASLGRR